MLELSYAQTISFGGNETEFYLCPDTLLLHQNPHHLTYTEDMIGMILKKCIRHSLILCVLSRGILTTPQLKKNKENNINSGLTKNIKGSTYKLFAFINFYFKKHYNNFLIKMNKNAKIILKT